jgi:hypothetical protein
MIGITAWNRDPIRKRFFLKNETKYVQNFVLKTDSRICGHVKDGQRRLIFGSLFCLQHQLDHSWAFCLHIHIQSHWLFNFSAWHHSDTELNPDFECSMVSRVCAMLRITNPWLVMWRCIQQCISPRAVWRYGIKHTHTYEITKLGILKSYNSCNNEPHQQIQCCEKRVFFKGRFKFISLRPVRIWVRIGPQHPPASRKGNGMGRSFGWNRK